MSCATESSLSRPGFPLRAVDRDLLEALRPGHRMGVHELTDSLQVTATAVRQRLERLRNSGLINREKATSPGRGRPTYSYGLTIMGYRLAGANPTELAEAMWQEILTLPDQATRERLLANISSRLGRQYRDQLADGSLESRMRSLFKLLAHQWPTSDISVETNAEGLPVLDVVACPYPTLTDPSDRRAMCQLEEGIFSAALERPVQLTRCCLDGDHSCQFSPVS